MVPQEPLNCYLFKLKTHRHSGLDNLRKNVLSKNQIPPCVLLIWKVAVAKKIKNGTVSSRLCAKLVQKKHLFCFLFINIALRLFLSSDA